MKKIKLFFVIMITLLSADAMCASGGATGKITKMRLFETIYDNNFWSPGEFWIMLEGAPSGSAGGCGSFSGNVLFVGKTQSTYSMLLAAYMADKEVSVVWDDQYAGNKSGLCIIRLVTM